MEVNLVLFQLIFLAIFTQAYRETIEEMQAKINGEDRIDISICVNAIVRKYLKHDYLKNSSTVFLNLLPNDESSSIETQEKILRLFQEDPSHEVNLIIKDDSFMASGDEPKTREKAKNYVILVTFPTEIVENIKKLQRLATWNHEAKFVVVVTERFADQFEMEVVVSGTFKLFFDYSILNVYVLIQNLDVDNLLQAFIWYPYDKNSCSNILSYNNLEIIDECETLNVTEEITELKDKYDLRELIAELPSRLPTDRRFHQCPMNVMTPIWEPFVLGTRDSPTGGIEFLLVKTIAEKLDMKAIYRVVDDATAFKEISLDEETGFYADLIKRKLDIMMGGLYDNPVSRLLLSSTIPFDSDEMTWCMQRSGLASNWSNIVAIFSIWLWTVVVIFLFICSISLYYFVKDEGIRKENFLWAVITTMCFSIGICGPYDPKKGYLRIYIGCLLMYGMHFNAAYNSFLLSVLTTPRYEFQASNIEEAVDAKYSFQGGENLKAFFATAGGFYEKMRYGYKSCYDMNACLLEIKYSKRLAVAISRQHAQNARIDLTENDMYCFDKANNLFSYSVVMLFKKDHHLLPLVNVLIRRMAEAGFILKWKADYEYMKFKEGLNNQNARNDQEKPLSMEHVLGVFGVIGGGAIIATLAFIGEWIHYLYHKKKAQNFGKPMWAVRRKKKKIGKQGKQAKTNKVLMVKEMEANEF